MTEKPIIFSGPMVRAILAGQKVQTRRVIKPQPPVTTASDAAWRDRSSDLWRNSRQYLRDCCPLPVGTRLWVRETYGTRSDLSHVEYRASHQEPAELPFSHIYDEQTKWRSSMFMPRNLSRISLLVTDVRCQWLQDITEEDAVAEGVDWIPDAPAATTRKTAYAGLWDFINAKRGFPWASNPWVWAYTFERIL